RDPAVEEQIKQETENKVEKPAGQLVKSKPKKKKKAKNKKNKESKEEEVPCTVEKEDQLKKEQINLHPVSRFIKDDTSDVQEDSANEDKFYSLDELHILDMVEQGSTGKVTADYGETEKERMAYQRQLFRLHYQCECIRPWLMQQGTCPTCRLHVLLPEEFPGHSSRQVPKI
ncbi:E3 ubiquitin-protein ligase DZIP3, partial [Tupaia chinensis]